MRIGVSGSTGFVGTHVVEAIRSRGHDVCSLARDPARAPQPSRQLDLSERPIRPGTFGGFDAVIHCAAYLPTSYEDASEAQRCMDINALGTLAVLQECVSAGVRKVICVSTNLYRAALNPVTEDAPFEPSAQASYYMVSKAAADFFAGHFTERLSVSILRLGSVYGPGLARGIIASFTDQLLAGKAISVDDGPYRADFVHVIDVVNATMRAVERDVEGPFNIGSGVASRPLDVARLLVNETGASEDQLKIRPAATERRGFCALDSSRAQAMLDHTPRSLADGLREYVQWKREPR